MHIPTAEVRKCVLQGYGLMGWRCGYIAVRSHPFYVALYCMLKWAPRSQAVMTEFALPHRAPGKFQFQAQQVAENCTAVLDYVVEASQLTCA